MLRMNREQSDCLIREKMMVKRARKQLLKGLEDAAGWSGGGELAAFLSRRAEDMILNDLYLVELNRMQAEMNPDPTSPDGECLHGWIRSYEEKILDWGHRDGNLANLQQLHAWKQAHRFMRGLAEEE